MLKNLLETIRKIKMKLKLCRHATIITLNKSYVFSVNVQLLSLLWQLKVSIDFKVEISNFCCRVGDIRFFLQKCLLSSPQCFI